MALIEEYTKTGNFLFRYRSFFPTIFILSGLISLILSRHNSGTGLHQYLELAMFFLALLGLIVRIITVGYAAHFTSGRNTHFQRADSLNKLGMYSIVRHPLYLANFIIWLSLAFYVWNVWFIILFCLAYWLYYERIMFAEEFFLRKKYGEEYLNWSENTPPFFPKFKNFKKPQFKFNYKKIFRAEVNGYMSIVAIFTVMNSLENLIMMKSILPDLMWIYIFSISLFVYIILKIIKKKTQLFADKIVDDQEEYYASLKGKK